MVTFPAEERHRQSAGTKLYCLVTEARACEQLAKGSGPAEARTRDLLDRERTLYRYATQATRCTC